jgi:ubiquinone/menaquinone biosynthesis C-methylase UbiE
MKARESGMPEEKIWEKFFDVEKILNELQVNNKIENLVDFGFGYGTFTIPASRKIKGKIYAYDIEGILIKKLESRLKINNIHNVIPFNKDFITEGTGLQRDEADYVMLFNILHAEKSADILSETFRILKREGKVGVIHWNYDSNTPRGPSMSIRPKPLELKNMLIESGFTIIKYNINLPPYHYGILAKK